MNKELKKEIIKFIFENDKDFQLVNNTVSYFRAYIYNSDGSFLIGGEDVYKFIKSSIQLLTTN